MPRWFQGMFQLFFNLLKIIFGFLLWYNSGKSIYVGNTAVFQRLVFEISHWKHSESYPYFPRMAHTWSIWVTVSGPTPKSPQLVPYRVDHDLIHLQTLPWLGTPLGAHEVQATTSCFPVCFNQPTQDDQHGDSFHQRIFTQLYWQWTCSHRWTNFSRPAHLVLFKCHVWWHSLTLTESFAHQCTSKIGHIRFQHWKPGWCWPNHLFARNNRVPEHIIACPVHTRNYMCPQDGQIYIYIYMYMCLCVYIFIVIQLYIYIYMYVLYIYIYIHIYTYLYIYIYTYLHNIYLYVQACVFCLCV